MNFVYPAIIHNDEDGFWLEFPDLVGCSTQADTLAELLENAKEALEVHALGLLEYGEVLPSPSNPATIELEANTFTSLISTNVDLAKNTKSVRKSLTIPVWLNDKALHEGINFSSVLQKALILELGLAR